MRCQIEVDYYDDEYEYYDDTDANADDNVNDNVAEDYYEDNRDGDAVIFPSGQAASTDSFSAGGDSTHLYPAYRDANLRWMGILQ